MPPVAVFDVNILISAVLSVRGPSFRCLALARTGVVESVTCNQILAE
jgi:predicted nucleic acid-binding protein